ncbi:phosphate acetyltransferase [Ectothiorhodospiraceae bacterium BW-2]|nr:phosphate acetyltransferase [Ectothiorhodospiraceae bacterium BW-2]
MAHNLYLHSSSGGSGLSVVALGLMEQLVGMGLQPGLFIPVTHYAVDHHPLLELLWQRYPFNYSPSQAVGCDLTQARNWIAAGESERLLKQIHSRYKEIEQQANTFLIIGPQLQRDLPAHDVAMSVEIANNLSSSICVLINGYLCSNSECVELVQIQREALHHHGAEVVAAIVNRVAPEQMTTLQQQLKIALSDYPVYLLRDEPLLTLPTVGEVATSLQSRWLHGSEADRQRDISGFKVAAMELTNFVGHLEDGDLVITPGDRADIILGTLLAHESNRYPHLAGLLLSGNLTPDRAIMALIEGQRHTSLPILTVASDTYDTVVQVRAVEPGLTADNSRKIALAIGLIEESIDRQWLQQLLCRQALPRMTPLMFEYELMRQARAAKAHIVLPEGADERILRAAEILLLRDICRITLLGHEATIRDKIARLGLQLAPEQIVEPASSVDREHYAAQFFQWRQGKVVSLQSARDTMADLNYFGTMMVMSGAVDGMVSGAAHTTQQTVRPAFQIIKTEVGRSIISSIFFMCLQDRVLVYGDCAVNPNPNAEQLADIAIASAATAAQFGIEPKVALLSYSSGDSGKGSDVETVRQATALVRQRQPQLAVEGPIQYDAAVDEAVAASKLPHSQVAGRATVFIFPDLNTGNNTYKAVQRSAGAIAIGPILQGLKRPVNDLSRGCSVADIINTVAITCIQAGRVRAMRTTQA